MPARMMEGVSADRRARSAAGRLALAAATLTLSACLAAPASDGGGGGRETSLSKLDEVLDSCTWESGGIATVSVHSPMFGRTVAVKLFPDDRAPDRQINDTMKEGLADFLALDASHVERLAELLLADCKFTFEKVGFGVDVLEGETEAEANHRDFGILTPADALAKSELKYVHVDGEKLPNRNFSIVFEAPWGDLEHIVVRNGRLLTFYQDGVYFGRFEKGPLASPEP